MNTNRNHDQSTSRATKVRTFLKYAWGDQVAAHRALLELRPYYDRQRQDGR